MRRTRIRNGSTGIRVVDTERWIALSLGSDGGGGELWIGENGTSG